MQLNSNWTKKCKTVRKCNKCIQFNMKGTLRKVQRKGAIFGSDFAAGIELLIEIWLILEHCCLWLSNICRTPINRWNGRVWARTSRRVHLPQKVDAKLGRQSMGKSIMHSLPNYSPQLLIRCLFIIMPHQTRCAGYGNFYTEKKRLLMASQKKILKKYFDSWHGWKFLESKCQKMHQKSLMRMCFHLKEKLDLLSWSCQIVKLSNQMISY